MPEYYLIFFRLTVAVLLGGLLGWERGHIGKAAGVRTYALVSLGSALFTLISVYGFPQAIQGSVDPSRIASQIVIGIGFLGAGSIFRHQSHIEGLTTAAGLWVVSAIGMAVGIGWVIPAITATVVVFILLIMFPWTHVQEEGNRTKKIL